MSDELKNPYNPLAPETNDVNETPIAEDASNNASRRKGDKEQTKSTLEGIKMSFKDGLVRKDNGLKYLIISLVVIIMDQITKYVCVYNIPYRSMGIEVLPFFNLVHIYNHGAAFSMLADWGGSQRYIFALIAIVMTVLFVFQLARTSSQNKWFCLSLVLFVGGAIGNLVDRIIHGYVIDFLFFYWKDGDTGQIIWSFPVFNVADISVCVGAFLLALVTFFPKLRHDDDEPKSNDSKATKEDA